VRKFGEKRNFKRSKGAGRPPSLSRADKISIRNCARANRYYSRIEIKNHLHLQVSCETIRQYLHYLGYSYKYPRKKQKLTQANKTERVNWATFLRGFDLSPLIFADETSIWLGPARLRMWIRKGEELDVETTPHPDKVSIFGAIGQNGQVALKVFQQNMNSEMLISILRYNLIPQANQTYGPGLWGLAWDNDSKHTSQLTQDYIQNHYVKIFPIFSFHRLIFCPCLLLVLMFAR